MPCYNEAVAAVPSIRRLEPAHQTEWSYHVEIIDILLRMRSHGLTQKDSDYGSMASPRR